MGILDFLTGNSAAASPYGALYPTEDDNAKRQAAAAAMIASMGVSPTNLPQISPFDLPQPPSVVQAPVAPAFGSGASPFGFAGPGSMNVNPSMLAAPAPAPIPTPAPAPALAPATDLSSVNRPPPAPAVDDEGPDEAAPAAPGARAPAAVAPGAPAAAAPFSLGGMAGGAGDRLKMATRGFMGNMGAGPLGALFGGLGALVTGSETDPTAIAQQKMNATGQALLGKGASLQDVQAAVNNPSLMTALLGQYYGKDKFKVVQTGENGMGGKTFQLMNEQDGTFKPIPGGAGGGAGGDAAGSIGPGDMSKTGAAYLATVPKGHRQILDGMLNGTIQPPSSFALAKPFWQSMIAGAKNADPNFDENTWAGRHKMTIDLAGSGNSSMGGILSNGKSAFEHLKIYSDKLANVGNYNGPDIPGGATIADVGNLVGNRILPRAETLDKIAGANAAGLKYGQESTKFYAGTGGGEAERMNALHSNDAKSTTSAAQAGFLQTEKELMLGRLREKENQIRSTMGDAYLQQHPVTTPELQQTITAIDANIAKLRGQGPAGAPGAAPAAARGTVNVGGKPISWSVN